MGCVTGQKNLNAGSPLPDKNAFLVPAQLLTCNFIDIYIFISLGNQKNPIFTEDVATTSINQMKIK